MAKAEPTKESVDSGAKPVDSVSHFLAKVLDQLSLTSWLPSVILVVSLSLLIQFHNQHNFALAPTLKRVSEARPVGLLVIVLFAIVVSAVLTQAFAFELIRLLEGYWGAMGCVKNSGQVLGC